MLFMAGPRQVGKTTLVQNLAESYTNHVYLNWDILSNHSRFIKNPTFFEENERKDESTTLTRTHQIPECIEPTGHPAGKSGRWISKTQQWQPENIDCTRLSMACHVAVKNSRPPRGTAPSDKV